MLSPWMTQNLFDANVKFTQPGLDVFLRVKNTVVSDSDEYAEYGFQLAQDSRASGFTDILIEPQPSVQAESMHNIGLNQTRLQFGAMRFDISHSFVEMLMAMKGYSDGYDVWRQSDVIGIVCDKRLYSLESVTHEDVAGATIRWMILGNTQEPIAAVE